MKSDEEILARIRELEQTDIFKWESNLLITFLPFRLAHPLLAERNLHYTDQWIDQDRSPAALAGKIRQFMDIALEMVIHHRGTKTQRSIDYFHAWIWLMGDEAMLAFMDDPDHFPQYGAPILKELCRRYQLSWPSDNPGLERMALGNACQPQGCPFHGCIADWRSEMQESNTRDAINHQ
ncbi:MAG: hypothetical protein HQL84_07305 [Magnetococcales bacterium]|nr:hypothetical protein [Magnetococcales bacterium]MBF0149837.1 hypothetical protein [Magnetococcales bacterium]MBF0174600.1 hypothetical protein [Magnetococcales bacterium]MBF0346575.1 hypothetical protein [Magnetococcales bacterium]MBF0631133.1 hypothetical protein [Magnetococcales bacterium]